MKQRSWQKRKDNFETRQTNETYKSRETNDVYCLDMRSTYTVNISEKFNRGTQAKMKKAESRKYLDTQEEVT